ncbi:DUF6783 domain-containing protein [Ruminococcus sp. RTP21358st1_A5_RTP21358_211008]|uniref:DUF6783 domain-containing protein n=1 Tax=Clostridia TaxID=186801 RepID=UPI0034A24E9F
MLFFIVLLLTKIQKGFIKSLESADCDAHLAESLFQTRSRNCTGLMYCLMPYCKINIIRRSTSE